jgi:hypothetical protein
MLLYFKKEFVPLVETYLKHHRNGKNQTIVAKRKDGKIPMIGDFVYLYTDRLLPDCRKLGECVVTKVSSVTIDRAGISLDGKFLSFADVCDFAKKEGFPNGDAPALFEWFAKEYGLPFTGTLIRWQTVSEWADQHPDEEEEL